MRDATTALLRAIGDKFGSFKSFRFDEIRSRSWASATFNGVRHQVELLLDGDGAETAGKAFLRGLGDAEFVLRGHILADIGAVSHGPAVRPSGPVFRILLEALTIEGD